MLHPLKIYQAWKRQPRLLRWLYGLASLMIFYLLLDFVIMPLYTRQYQSIPVPDVSFISLEEAEKILKKKGLLPIRGAEKFDEQYPAGFVLFQSPLADSPVKKGRRVYLTLSKGRRILQMPKLIGMAERDARFNISEMELSLGTIYYRTDAFYPDGVVCAQSIEPGKGINIGTRVQLTVSLGVEPVVYIVPEVVGKSRGDAERAILKAGLQVGRVSEQATNELLPNTIVSQSLSPGLEVLKGDVVDLVVSVLPE